MSTTPPTEPEPSPEDEAEDAPEELDLSHEWMVAAAVPVDERGARLARLRRAYHLREGEVFRALDVYCYRCHLPIDHEVKVDVVVTDEWDRPILDGDTGEPKTVREAVPLATQPCTWKLDNTHLIGGNPGKRKRQKDTTLPEGAVLESGGTIQRVGVEAAVNGP